MTRFASYALDIGVYNIGRRGQILSSTTTAWARASDPVESFEILSYSGTCDSGLFADTNGHTWACGRSVRKLADRIGHDIGAGLRMAIGFEAPMWFPIVRGERAGLQLFGPRFDAERGSEWYLQSGAAATLKAMSLGTLLMSLLLTDFPTLALTTEFGSGRGPALIQGHRRADFRARHIVAFGRSHTS